MKLSSATASSADRIGSGASQAMAGHVNHFSQIRVLTRGEAAEMAASPSIRPQIPPFAQATALTCNSPFAFRISQAAPMKL